IVVKFPAYVTQGFFSNFYLRFCQFTIKCFFCHFLFFQQVIFSSGKNGKQDNNYNNQGYGDCYCSNYYNLFFIHKKPVRKNKYIIIISENCITIKSSKKLLGL